MTRISALATAAALALAAGAASAHERPWGARGPAPDVTTLDFAAIDTDGDGSLSRAELQARAVERLARADADGDGFLDREELLVIVPGGGGGPFRVFSADPAMERVDRLLALLGATEAGRVEVAAVAERRVNMLLAAADTDRDAAISQAEADARASRHHRGDRRGHHGGHHGGPDGRPGMDRGPDGGPEAPAPDAGPAPDQAPDPTNQP